MRTCLYIVVPCYNEEACIDLTASILGQEKLSQLVLNGIISQDSRILFINDGSTDKTWEKIVNLHNKNPDLYSGLSLTRNRGHQNALLAGLMYARTKADVVISMDADLQDDVNAIDKMLEKYFNGSDIVYGVRSSRKKDSFFKRFTAESFYKFMSWCGVDIVFNHADFRLMSRKSLDKLSEFKEVNLFLRAIVPLIGYKTSSVYYKREERKA